MSRFSHLKGTMTRDEFSAMMRQTRYKKKTWGMLFAYLGKGRPYAQTKGASRQFVYKKLVELEERGLLNNPSS